MILIMPPNVASNNYANLNKLNNLHPHHPLHTTPPPKKNQKTYSRRMVLRGVEVINFLKFA